jgi:hypothetical protein
LRLLGVLGERKPSLNHFDEKGLMLRTAGCLRQPRFAHMMNEGGEDASAGDCVASAGDCVSIAAPFGGD